MPRVTTVKNRDKPESYHLPIDLFQLGCRMIEVVVGGDECGQTFTVHAPILLGASAYLAGALKDTFREGQTNRIEHKEEQSVHFGMIVEYLYLGKIREFQISDLGCMETMPPMVDLFHAWLLAHYLQIPSILNYAPWCLLRRWDEGKWTGQFINDKPRLEELYKKSPVDSMMRKFLVDLLVWGDNEELQTSDDPPKLMMSEAFEEMKRKSGGKAKNPLLDMRKLLHERGIDPQRHTHSKSRARWS